MGDLAPGALMIISSQLPVGSTRQIEAHYAAAWPDKPVTFACSPENLRLGNAISVFMQPDRVIAGVRSDTDRQRIGELQQKKTEFIAEIKSGSLNNILARKRQEDLVSLEKEIIDLQGAIDAYVSRTGNK